MCIYTVNKKCAVIKGFRCEITSRRTPAHQSEPLTLLARIKFQLRRLKLTVCCHLKLKIIPLSFSGRRRHLVISPLNPFTIYINDKYLNRFYIIFCKSSFYIFIIFICQFDHYFVINFIIFNTFIFKFNK